jgi:hypothetical protein
MLKNSSPEADAKSLAEHLSQQWPQFKMTGAKACAIEEAYKKELARIEKLYGKYLTGRGIKA